MIRERPVGLKLQRTTSTCGSRARTRGSISPAIPFAPSTTIRSGAIASRRRSRAPARRTRPTRPPPRSSPACFAPLARTARSRISTRPDSLPTGNAPRRTIFIPVYCRRVVRGGHHDPAVEPQLARREVHDLGSDHPEVGHVGAAVCDTARSGLGHRRRGQSHVPPDRHPARLELLRERASDRVRTLLVELRRVERARRRMP